MVPDGSNKHGIIISPQYFILAEKANNFSTQQNCCQLS